MKKTTMKNLCGLVFGYLTALEPTEQRFYSNVVWRCRCDCLRNTCAKIIYVPSYALTNGHTTSCRNHQHDLNVHAAIRRFYGNNRDNAIGRGYIFTITLEQFHSLIKLPCQYCGLSKDIKRIKQSNGKYWQLRANGIDRLDNTIGYIFENCASCCEHCNYAKKTMSVQEYIDHCKRVALHNL